MTTASAEVRWQNEDAEWQFTGLALGSRIMAGPDAKLRDGTVLRTSDMGVGGRIQLIKSAGRVLGSLIYETYSPKLELNDVGYLRSQNVHRLFLRLAHRTLDVGAFRESTFGVELFDRESWDGANLSRGVQVNHKAVWQSFWETWIELQAYPSILDNREVGDGAWVQRTAQLGLEASLSTNTARPVSFTLDGLLRNTWKGASLDLSAQLNVRPLSRLELSLAPTFSRVSGDPRHLQTVSFDGSAKRYRFGLQDALAPGITLRASVALSPQLSFDGYAQLFLSSVRYTSLYEVEPSGEHPTAWLAGLQPSNGAETPIEREAVLNWNLVLRYEFLPGSILYAVFSRNHGGGAFAGSSPTEGGARLDFAALGRAPVTNTFLLKATYFFAR